MTEKKITKKEKFTSIIEILEGSERSVNVSDEDLVAFCRHEIELLDNKAAKSKNAAAAKKEQPDELTEKVKTVLTDEFEGISAITAKLEDEEITNAKVQYRLNQLAKAGFAEKGEITVTSDGKSRKLIGYKLAD